MGKNGPLFAEVALALPVNKNLDYEVPPTLKETIEIGIRVLVPLEKRKVTGYVLKLKTFPDIADTKYIEEILEPFPLFNPPDLNFYKWIASYYFCPLGYVIKNALPPGINVTTLKHLSITSKGKKALNDKTLSQSEKDLLSILAEKRKVTLKTLKNSFKDKRVFTLISSLLRKEYVTMTQSKSLPKIRPQKEKVFEVNEDELSRLSFSELKRIKRKSPRQFHILKWLRKKKKATQKEVSFNLGKVDSALKGLEIKKLINISIQEKYRSPLINYEETYSEPWKMTSEQAKALKEIISKVRERKYASFLLHGITGSGKTEVYLKAIEATLKTGRGALVLVPEIALTPQLIARFKARFGSKIAQLHSGLSKGERFDEWRRIKYGEVQMVIGARSAIFAPLKSLGIIIVDEEHDSAYKQDERICYNARDLALVKGKMNNAVVVLGSATPTIETYHNTRVGKISYLSLSRRIDNRPLPRVEVLDMRNEKPGTILSLRLRNAIKERWERGEQTLLFLNRRGFSPFVLCQECGYSFRCPNCNVSLVFHQDKRLLICHYCNFCKPKTDTCPECGSNKVRNFGFGTERLETEIHRYFPQLKVGRLDKDTTVKKNSLPRILEQFRKGETDLLIGTQMIAMGHDLPQVTLVGVVAADISLNFPDFRSGERTFQLLTQVAGRSGRGQIPGEVIIQTYNPNHPCIRMAKDQDFLPFYEEEILFRKELKYPPFQRLVNFRMVGNSLSKTRDYASSLGKLSNELQKKEQSFQNNIEILGPAEAPWEKLKGKYRWQMLVKGKDYRILHQCTEKVFSLRKPQIKISGVKLTVDVDPLNLL